MKMTYMMARGWVTAPAPNDVARDGMLGLAGRGNSVTKRAATVAGSGYADDSSGSAAINDANLWVAAPPGSSDYLAASCHGSISNRARAERTLSTIPLPSSTMGANRKLSNSGPSCENLAIASTELHYIVSIEDRPAMRSGYFYCMYRSHKISHGSILRQARKLPKIALPSPTSWE
jgi:hypothetical protein